MLTQIDSFIGRFSSPAPSARNPGLDDYCGRLIEFLHCVGYEIGHADQYNIYRNFPDLAADYLSPRLCAHFNTMTQNIRAGNLDCQKILQDVSGNINAYAERSDKTIMLPQEEGLLERFCRHVGAEDCFFRALGMTDQDLYAFFLIHEAAHVVGYDPDWREDSFIRNEFYTHAKGYASYLDAGGYQPHYVGPWFISRVLAYLSLKEGPAGHTDETRYAWADQAFDRVILGWQDRERFWDAQTGQFQPAVLESFKPYGGFKTENPPRAFGLARTALASATATGLWPLHGAIQSLEAYAQTENGPPLYKEAAYILLKYHAILYDLLPYAVPGQNLARDCAVLFPSAGRQRLDSSFISQGAPV